MGQRGTEQGGTQASVASHAQRQLIKAPRIAHKLVISITQFQCQRRERAGSPLLALARSPSPLSFLLSLSLCFFPSHFELLLSFTVVCEFCSNFQSIMLMRIYVMAYEAYPHTHTHTCQHTYSHMPLLGTLLCCPCHWLPQLVEHDKNAAQSQLLLLVRQLPRLPAHLARFTFTHTHTHTITHTHFVHIHTRTPLA